jgi:hypothetical protein
MLPALVAQEEEEEQANRSLRTVSSYSYCPYAGLSFVLQ